MGRFINGVLSATGGLLFFGANMAVVNYFGRSWAAHRLVEKESDLTAEAVMILL